MTRGNETVRLDEHLTARIQICKTSDNAVCCSVEVSGEWELREYAVEILLACSESRTYFHSIYSQFLTEK